MSDENRNKVKLNARVTPIKKQEWKDKIGEGETLNGVVRRAVDRELNDEYVHVDVLNELNTDTDASNNDEITNELNELRDTVTQLSNQINTLQSTQHPANTDEDSEKSVEELAIEAIDELPAHPRDTPREATGRDLDDRELIKSLIEGSRAVDDYKTLDGRAEAVAAQLNEPVWRVRESLNHLEHSTTERVKSVILSDGRHWMRL